ncbi:DNA-processing protein DprA [uncultured Bacteroides sp.]|uniref:DNA-processing protein DprA n=1 Tax=uncultured Bacteroides sp. TaxID=162156 RepID=UPI002AA8DF5C|nr:DNA-processing protein DprA [uncultured Bacteroides sp.]
MSDEERIYSIALTQVPGIGPIWACNLINAVGDAVSVFKRRGELPQLMKGATSRIVQALDCPQALQRAEKEYEFIVKNNIRCLTINEEAYPCRMRECDDAPIVLFYKGNAELNALRTINMVGTRNATDYGKQICLRFLNELSEQVPDVLVVSGLAYGIDIHAHRAALANNLSTVGVLAHGFDRIYPSVHRKTAVDMLAKGGLLTEFLTETNPDKHNFVSRNRIVAGICDATIVVESAAKGGSLITADIAESYHRDCFAFPGRVNDIYSVGCNQLIRDNKAILIQSAEDFVRAMCWDAELHPSKGENVQRLLFPDLNDEEQLVVSLLEKGDQQINTLVVTTDIPVHKMNSILFELEMKGVIRVLAGGMYQLLG